MLFATSLWLIIPPLLLLDWDLGNYFPSSQEIHKSYWVKKGKGLRTIQFLANHRTFALILQYPSPSLDYGATGHLPCPLIHNPDLEGQKVSHLRRVSSKPRSKTQAIFSTSGS